MQNATLLNYKKRTKLTNCNLSQFCEFIIQHISFYAVPFATTCESAVSSFASSLCCETSYQSRALLQFLTWANTTFRTRSRSRTRTRTRNPKRQDRQLNPSEREDCVMSYCGRVINIILLDIFKSL